VVAKVAAEAVKGGFLRQPRVYCDSSCIGCFYSDSAPEAEAEVALVDVVQSESGLLVR